MDNLKHIGRIKATGRKAIVAYRTLPGESDSALVVQTESLTNEQHDAIMKLVESPAGQNAYEFAEVMARVPFQEGGLMLNTLHFAGKLTKVKTSEVDMMPNTQTSISLDQLNQYIAEQRGISVNDLALGNQTSVKDIASVNNITPSTLEKETATQDVAEQTTSSEPLSDADLAKKYRSDADRLSKEAAALRRMAEEIAPTKKKTTTVE
jgi:hypothetical protein